MKNKKKIITGTALVAALAVGGTAAFFTSSDLITNVFQTGTTTDVNDPNAGIDVNEEFKGPQWTVDENGNLVKTETEFDTNDKGYGEVTGGPTQVLPGDLFTKQVRVSSEANYNQFIRARVEVSYANLPSTITVGKNTITNEALIIAEAAKYLEITYNTAEAVADGDGVWTGAPTKTTGVSMPAIAVAPAEQEWFYYSKVLAPQPTHTADLIKTVQLTTDAPNWMKNVTFNVIVKAESIQASKDAWLSWGQAGETIPTQVDKN